MKRIIAIILFVISTYSLWAQVESASVLTNNAYFTNPRLYLSKLIEAKIQSQVLVDRTIYSDLILNCNGTNKVTTLTSADWDEIYNTIKYSCKDTSTLSAIDTLEKIAYLHYKSTRKYPVFFLDVAFKRISAAALAQGQFFQGNDFLSDNLATTKSYSSERVFAASCMQHNLTGDEISFLFDDAFYISSNPNLVVEKIEADFDDNLGFRIVANNQTVKINYGSESRYLELKFKLTLRNKLNNSFQILIANSTLFRTGTDAYIEPSIIGTQLRSVNPYITRPDLFYFPVGQEIQAMPYTVRRFGKNVTTTMYAMGAKLEVYTLLNSTNTSGKLRKPFIVCDGFDPGDTRDYYCTLRKFNYDTPKDNDFRGLLSLINGDKSPWYEDVPDQDADLVTSLQERGYDIVIVNFLDGAGDIFANAEAFYGLLQQFNTPEFRTSETEEAVVVGPSMGGLITRIALNKFKAQGLNPNVKTWISFDSPHGGAYIPLSLQCSIDLLRQCTPVGCDSRNSINGIKDKFLKLNSFAAKQLLLQYAQSTNGVGTADNAHLVLSNVLAYQGYPILSKNYAISNGGLNKLYPDDAAKNVDYENALAPWTFVLGWINSNTNVKSMIFKGERAGPSNNVTVYSSAQVAYDNAPGGWNAALYSINYLHGNKNRPSTYVDPKVRACFIPTVSAFGFTPTRGNVHSTWEQYTGRMQLQSGKTICPFDVVRGMQTNEEHVRISLDTKDYILESFEEDYKNVNRPIVRGDETIHQSVDVPVSYLGKGSLTFAGVNGNTFTIQPTADVKAMSDSVVIFSPGFTASAGSTMTATIGTPSNGFRSAKVISPKRKIDYSIPSPYEGKQVNYTLISSSQYKEEIIFTLLSNPVKDVVEVSYSDLSSREIDAEIYNLSGERFDSEKFENDGKLSINVSTLSKGTYVIKLSYGDQSSAIKFIKQ